MVYRACASCGLPVMSDDATERGSHLSCVLDREARSLEVADAIRVAADHFAASDLVSWGRSMLHRTEDGARTLCGMAVGAGASFPTGSAALGSRCPRCEGTRLTR